MSALLNPRGPESPATYWRRRLVVVAVALLVLALAGWLLALLTGPGGDKTSVSATPANDPTLASSAPSATPTPSATPSTTASASPAASSSASAKPSTKPSATPTPTPTGLVACDPAALAMTLEGDRRPTIGKPTTWTIGLANKGGQACRLDLAKNPLSLQVTSGSDEIWSTADCGSWVSTKPVDLAKGSAQVKVNWTLQRSAKSCKLSSEELRAGTYVASAQLAGGPSGRLVMMLHF